MSGRRVPYRLLRWVGLVCIMTMLLAMVPSCDGPDSVSDEAVTSAAKAFARAMKAAGKTAEQVLEQAREEAEKWGPKAQLFIDTVLDELR